jgi:hypothetical protein
MRLLANAIMNNIDPQASGAQTRDASSITATFAGRSATFAGLPTNTPQEAQYTSLGRCAAPQVGQESRLAMATYSSIRATRIRDAPRPSSV